MAPTRNIKFQVWAFQLKSKNFTFLPAPQAAQMVRKLEEKPNDFPKNSRMAITRTITIPEVYHGQGCFNNSSICADLFKFLISKKFPLSSCHFSIFQNRQDD